MFLSPPKNHDSSPQNSKYSQIIMNLVILLLIFLFFICFSINKIFQSLSFSSPIPTTTRSTQHGHHLFKIIFFFLYILILHMRATFCEAVQIQSLSCINLNLLVHRIQLHEAVSTVPTIGFNVETVCIPQFHFVFSSLHFPFLVQVKYKNLTFQVWDLGGQTSIRPYWRCYFPDTGISALSALFYAHSLDAIVFVVDSADYDRLSIARSELDVILNVSTRIPSLSQPRRKNFVAFLFWSLPTSRMFREL